MTQLTVNSLALYCEQQLIAGHTEISLAVHRAHPKVQPDLPRGGVRLLGTHGPLGEFLVETLHPATDPTGGLRPWRWLCAFDPAKILAYINTHYSETDRGTWPTRDLIDCERRLLGIGQNTGCETSGRRRQHSGHGHRPH